MDENNIEQLYLNHEYLVAYWIKTKYGARLPSDVQNDLESAGLMALHTAAQNYDPENEEGAKFKTYASTCIKLSFANYWKTKNKPELAFDDTVKPPKSDEFLQEDKEQSARIGKKEPDRQALQILEVLRMWSDENHTLTQQDIMDWHYAYCYEKYGFTDKPDRRTMSKLIKNLILELDPYEYSGDNKDDYKLLYEGFDKDLMKKSLEDDDEGKITGISLVHPFSNGEMDKLIEAVCFSDMLTGEEKTRLVKKLFATASEYYRSPFWDKADQKILFNPVVLQGRLSKKFGGRSVADNNSIVQKAISGRNVISFKFCHYTEDGSLEPNKMKDSDEDRIYTLQPYHLVVYHDNYYCLGFHEGSKNIYHYRVDLMSDIELVTDSEGNPVTEETVPVDDYRFVGDFWNPERYMAEHLYMAYGNPCDIKLKIDNRDKKGFTFLRDWFGDHYELLSSRKESAPDHITVTVKADPKMLVHWAMQYAGLVEVLDDEVRELIREELEMLGNKYE
ncbi:MAG: WYL domain-containing protein [Clostridiales bacterium]|nr:WYL domain-containing protein [Clostridiales bacterium]